MIVTNIENLGEIVLVYSRLSPDFACDARYLDEVVAKVNLNDFDELKPKAGDRIELLFDKSTIYLFDKHSGKRIR